MESNKQTFRFLVESTLDGFETVQKAEIIVSAEIGGEWLADMTISEAFGHFMNGALSAARFDFPAFGVGANLAQACAEANNDPLNGHSHGLNKPKNETENQRENRFAAEFARQDGYNAGLRGNQIPENRYNDEYYLRGHAKGILENANWALGYYDGISGNPNVSLEPAYNIGYCEGAAKAIKTD